MLSVFCMIHFSLISDKMYHKKRPIIIYPLWGTAMETLWLLEKYMVIYNEAFSQYLFAGKMTLCPKKYTIYLYISYMNRYMYTYYLMHLKIKKWWSLAFFFFFYTSLSLFDCIYTVLVSSSWHLSMLKFLLSGRQHWLRFKSKWCE